jgi:hypothetical protein
LLFVVAAWFFGGTAGAVVGTALALVRLRTRTGTIFWTVGVGGLVLAALATIVQGLPFGFAGPQFGARHWVAHAAVGVALASLAMAAFIDIGKLRAVSAGRPPSADPDTGRREAGAT